MSPELSTWSAFAAAALGVLAVYSILSDLYLRDRTRLNQRLDDEFRPREPARRQLLFKDGKASSDSFEELEEATSVLARLEMMLKQSGLALTPRRLLMWTLAAGLTLTLLPLLLDFGVGAAIVLGLFGSALPLVYVLFKRQVRLDKLMQQLPDAFDAMARVIRAGQTMSQALQAVADEFDPPISTEFSYCFEQMNLGLSPELALRDLGRRTGVLELKIFVLAILIQSQTGGNLAEMLDKLATIIRERFRIKGKIKALTAEGRMQALVLLALPPALFFIILAVNPHYAQVLLAPAHRILLIGVFVFEVVGAVWIRKIVNFDF